MTDEKLPPVLGEVLDANFTQAKGEMGVSFLECRTHDQGWVQSAAIRRDRARAMVAALRWANEEVVGWSGPGCLKLGDAIAALEREITASWTNVPAEEIDVQYSPEVETDIQQILDMEKNQT